jgi:hypothetical protein
VSTGDGEAVALTEIAIVWAADGEKHGVSRSSNIERLQFR